MIEVRCSSCNKVTAYLALGSRVANGTIMTCVHCQEYRPPPNRNPTQNNDIPDFLKCLFRHK